MHFILLYNALHCASTPEEAIQPLFPTVSQIKACQILYIIFLSQDIYWQKIPGQVGTVGRKVALTVCSNVLRDFLRLPNPTRQHLNQ